MTLPSVLLSQFPGTEKVALGEGPWAVQGAGSLDRGRVCYALRCVVVPYRTCKYHSLRYATFQGPKTYQDHQGGNKNRDFIKK